LHIDHKCQVYKDEKISNKKSMALWDKISSRGNVEDRRGAGPLLLGGGGLGVAGVVIMLLLNVFGGGDVSDILYQLESMQVPTEQADSTQFSGEDNYEVFASTVLGSNNEMWSKVFSQNNLTYREPKLVLFRGATESGCGVSSSAIGPHYCPADETIYLDETFFNELQTRLGAQGGDVAEAYVMAHEVGHHVQNLLGVTEDVVRRQESNQEQANELSVRQELQADCFAGLWSHSIKDLGVFAPGEINEAIDAAAAVGDDRIQKATQGQVQPESWTHGSAAQRVEWFNKGFDSGDVGSCNTF
jgi:uncharacterized protein